MSSKENKLSVKTLYGIVDGLAPFALSKEYCEKFGHRDNSGVQLDCGSEVKGVLFSLDLSQAAVAEAKKLGANCIITHHPAIFFPLYSLKEEGSGSEILACAKEGISVISAHLNLDAAEGGIDESLMLGLGGSEALAAMDHLTGGGYGRVYDVEKKSLAAFTAEVEKTFCSDRVVTYGNGTVSRVASFCGAGFDEGALAFATAHGADTIVSSEAKHHLIAAAVERGLNVILLTHYAAEHYGFTRFAEKIKKLLNGTPCFVFTDERLL